MTTIEQIKEECREQITRDANMEPACFRGGFTPKAARALLDLIAYVEEDLAYPLLALRAREKLETICRTWEGLK